MKHLERNVLRFLVAAVVPFMAFGPMAYGFEYADFSSIDGLNLVGDSQQAGSTLRLTVSRIGEVGAVWAIQKQGVELGFVTQFAFQIPERGARSDQPELGGDGLAFVVQNTSVTSIGGGGIDMGYGGIPNSLAVELDTYANNMGGDDDPDNNHISVQTAGALPNNPRKTHSLAVTSAIPLLDDGDIHQVKIAYIPGEMNVYIDDLVNPVLTVGVDLASTLNLDSGQAWVGLTAGTGAAYETHDILNWSFAPYLQILAVNIDIRPGADVSPVNLKSKGVLPVTIFGSEEIDVSMIDLSTLVLQGAGPRPRGKSGKVASFVDMNGDSYLDLNLHFDLEEMDVSPDDTEFTLTGMLNDGTQLEGSDAISIIQLGDAVEEVFLTGVELSDTVIPEPATLASLALGGLALIRRRRR